MLKKKKIVERRKHTRNKWVSAVTAQNPGIKKGNARGRLRVRTAGVLEQTQTEEQHDARENNQEKPGRRLSVQ